HFRAYRVGPTPAAERFAGRTCRKARVEARPRRTLLILPMHHERFSWDSGRRSEQNHRLSKRMYPVTNRFVRSVFSFAAVMAMVWLTPVAAQRGQRPGADEAPGAPSGCPDEPVKFRPCAIEKAKTFNPPRTPD